MLSRGIAAVAAVAAMAFSAAGAQAATTAYPSQSGFEAALDGDFTLINLDALSGVVGKTFADTELATPFGAAGLTSIGINSVVAAGNAGQNPTPRDRLLANGATFGGQLAFDFATGVNGVGAWSNWIDGGRVRIFSGAGLTGFIGEAGFGGAPTGAFNAGFGGITSDVLIRSVQITCDFNGDFRCGVYDIQFGTFAVEGGVPEPGTWALMIGGFGLMGAAIRRRRIPAV